MRIRSVLESPEPEPKPAGSVSPSVVDRSNLATRDAKKNTGDPKKISGGSPSSSVPTARSDALTLLSTLQREARLVDLICEPLEQFSDAQIGAAAREVLRDSRQTLDRLFAVAPLAEQEEGQPMSLSTGFSAARVRLVGKSQGTHGVVVHRGWQATKCELPDWQGDRKDALILTPTEVEVS